MGLFQKIGGHTGNPAIGPPRRYGDDFDRFFQRLGGGRFVRRVNRLSGAKWKGQLGAQKEQQKS